MKKFLGIFVVLLAIDASAFTSTSINPALVGNSYTYDWYGLPGQDDPVNIFNPANYTLVGNSPLVCPVGLSHLCAVEGATDNEFGQPDFSKPYTVRLRN